MIREILDSQAKLAFLVLLGMIAVIGSVLAFEHLGGYIPCSLCLKQRIAYYIAIPLGLVVMTVIATKGSPGLIRAGLIVVGLLVLSSLAIAIYHSGVEWAFWPGPAECGSGAGDGGPAASADNILNQLKFAKPPSCDVAAGRFLGLSFAGWNVVVSAIIAWMAFRAAKLSK